MNDLQSPKCPSETVWELDAPKLQFDEQRIEILKKCDELPRKLGELTLLAVADIEKAEASLRHIVDMYRWHTDVEAHQLKFEDPSHTDTRCHVCMAGSVLAFTVGELPEESWADWDFRNFSSLKRRMYALDCMAKGELTKALSYMWGFGASMGALLECKHPDLLSGMETLVRIMHWDGLPLSPIHVRYHGEYIDVLAIDLPMYREDNVAFKRITKQVAEALVEANL